MDRDEYFRVTELLANPSEPFPDQSRYCVYCRECKDISHWTKSTLYYKLKRCRECQAVYSKNRREKVKETIKQRKNVTSK